MACVCCRARFAWFPTPAAIAAGSPGQIFDTEIENTIRLYATPVLSAAGLEPDAVAIHIVNSPALNAWFNGRERSRRVRKTIDLGIAVDIEDGLFVPVLRDVGRRAAEDLRDGLERLKRDIRARTLPAAEVA